MRQITEDYVSYETAQLLKEKGFDVPVQRVYSNKGEICETCCDYSNQYKYHNWLYPCPSQSLALKWLREVHNIFIEIKYVPNQFTDEPSYKAMIWDMSEEIGKPLPNDIEFAFYETCVNEALKYTLENLI